MSDTSMTESSTPHTILHKDNGSVVETSTLEPIIVDGQPNPNHRIRKFLGISILAPILLLPITPLATEFFTEHYHYPESWAEIANTILYSYSAIDVFITIGCLIAVFIAKERMPRASIVVIQSILGGLTGLISLIIAIIVAIFGVSFIYTGTARIGCTEFCGLTFILGYILVFSIAFIFVPLYVISSWARYVAIQTSKNCQEPDRI